MSGKKLKAVKSKTLTKGQVKDLAEILKRCKNIPIKNVSDFTRLIRLRAEVRKEAAQINEDSLEIIKSHGVEEVEGFLNWENKPELNKALAELYSQDVAIDGAQDLDIEPIEIGNITAGLSMEEADFVSDMLCKSEN